MTEEEATQVYHSMENVSMDVGLRRIYLAESELTHEYLAEATRALMALDQIGRAPIQVWISSGGGAISSTFALMDVAQIVQSPIYTVGYGVVASAAAVLLQMGGERYVLPHTQVMVHAPTISAETTVENYDVGDVDHFLDMVSRDRESLAWIERAMLRVFKRREVSDEFLVGMTKAERWARGGKAIVEAGLADEVVSSKRAYCGLCI